MFLGKNMAEQEEFKCPHCDFVAKSQGALSTHILHKHERKAPEETAPQPKEKQKLRIFEEPIPPTELLIEVLRKFGIREECIDFIADESRASGGLHPIVLHQMLDEFSQKFTGIDDKKIIPYIVKRYDARLAEEQNKAREMKVHYIYPSRPASYERRTTLDYGYRTREYEAPERTYGYGYSYGYGYREPPPDKPLTATDVRAIFEDMLQRKAKEDELTKLREELYELKSKISEIAEEAAEKAASRVATKTPEDVVTTKTLADILEKKEKESEIRYLEKKLETEKEIREKMSKLETELREKERQALLEKIAGLEKKIEEKSTPVKISTEGYKEDSVRLIADTLQAAGLQDRRPLQEIRKVIVEVARPSEEPPPKREPVGKPETVIGLLKEMGGEVE